MADDEDDELEDSEDEGGDAEPEERAILIVTGTSFRAEEVDRPLAYYLKDQVERALAESDPDDPPHVYVVADLRRLQDESMQAHPAISVGGPGVNLVARQWLEELPVALAVEDEYFIQMHPDAGESDEVTASIWGMDNAQTQIAVAVFVRRHLPEFLRRARAVLADDGD